MANCKFQVTLYYGEKRDYFRVEHCKPFPERGTNGIYDFYTKNEKNQIINSQSFPVSRCHVEYLGEVEETKETTLTSQREFVVNTVRGIES
jgi:hypothetical protein